MTASFPSLLFLLRLDSHPRKTPPSSVELDIMSADIVLPGACILLVLIAVAYWICYWLACKSKRQSQDEEQADDVAVNWEEDYESIFVNPLEVEQPMSSYTPSSLGGSRDTEIPSYRPIGTPPPSYLPAYKALRPYST